MKNALTLCFILLVGGATMAQDNLISRHFAEEEASIDYDNINVTRKTFDLFAAIESSDAEEIRVLNAFQELDGIKAIFKEHDEQAHAEAQEAIAEIMASGEYEELMSVRTGKENVLMTIREVEGKVKELSIIVGAEQNFMVATIFGNIDLKSLSRMTNILRKNGKAWFKHFENISNEELAFMQPAKNRDEAPKATIDLELNIRIFPNPVGNYLRLESQNTTNQTYQLEFFSLLGEPLKSKADIRLPYELKLTDLPAGTYLVRLTNQAGIFKNYKILKP